MAKVYEFNSHDKTTTLYVELKAALEKRLKLLRERNDSLLQEQETNLIRGEIRAVKDLLSDMVEEPIEFKVRK